MTIQDIIGTKICVTPTTVYEIVQGHSPWTFALKYKMGETYNSVDYTIDYYNNNIKRGTWEIISEPKQKQATMEKQYITTKDLPDIAEGTISDMASSYSYLFKTKAGSQVWYTKELVEETDFFREYIAPFNPKIGDYLYCHTSLIMNDHKTEEATKGKMYKCEENECFTNNSGNKCHGLWNSSASEWFRLATEREIKAYENLNKEVKVTIGIPHTEVTITKEGVLRGNVRGNNSFVGITIHTIRDLIDDCSYLETDSVMGYSVKVVEVVLHIGCEEGIDTTLSDLRKIVNAYESLS